MQMNSPLFLENQIQHYAWGDRGEQAFIPHLLGIPAVPETPYAELWIGAHPVAPSLALWEGKKIPLNDLVAERPETVLGKRVVQQFGPQLPFLLKVLSAADALSIQVHPNKKQAKLLHTRDPEHYPDANHKPEIAIALDGLKALAGFKSFEDTVQTLKAFPEIARFAGNVATEVSFGEKQPSRVGHWVREVYLTVLKRSEENPGELEGLLRQLDKRLAFVSSRGDELAKWYVDLRQKYGTDVGLLSLFLLRLVNLHPGEAIFIGAGVPHAYLCGNIIECMANSDNVVRAGLTPKFKDVAAMAEVLAPEPEPIPVYQPDPAAELTVYNAPIEEFRVTRLNWPSGRIQKMETKDSVQIFLVVTGEFLLFWGEGEHIVVQKGQSVLVPATVGRFKLEAATEGLAFLVDVPERE